MTHKIRVNATNWCKVNNLNRCILTEWWHTVERIQQCILEGFKIHV